MTPFEEPHWDELAAYVQEHGEVDSTKTTMAEKLRIAGWNAGKPMTRDAWAAVVLQELRYASQDAQRAQQSDEDSGADDAG
jgi:hypothetical protein